MKSIILLLFLGLVPPSYAQNAVPNGTTNNAGVATAPGNAIGVTNVVTPTFAVTARGANERVLQSVTAQTNALGQTTLRTNSYTELATGMHYWNGSSWADASDQIHLTANGAAATNTQHQVRFTANLNTSGAVDLTTPDGQQMASHILGLAYTDSSSGKNVLFAETQDSIGQLLSSGNQVVYTNAFTNADCDVLYTHSLAGFEQDIVIRAQLPSPAAYGLAGSNIWLQVWTEFSTAPDPQVSQPEGGGDSFLDFGVMKMGRGKAFMLGDPAHSVPVVKDWVNTHGRTFLVESVLLNTIASRLAALPLPPGSSGGSNSIPPANSGSGEQSKIRNTRSILASMSPPRPDLKRLKLPAPKMARKDSSRMRLADASFVPKGLELDYNLVNGGQTNLIFRNDSTYLITNVVNLYGTCILEGGTVIKYATNESAKIIATFYTNLVCHTAAYRPAIFTALDDDTVGSPISGSTGTPTGYYGGAGIQTQSPGSGSTPVWSHLRFSYLRQAIHLENSSSTKIYDAQFVNCREGLYLDTVYFYLRNALFSNVATNFYCVPETAYIDLQNVTVDGGDRLCTIAGFEDYPWDNAPGDGPDFSMAVTNCLFIGTTNLGVGLNLSGDPHVSVAHTVILTNGAGVFQTVGGGGHYLADNTYRGYGTTSIDATLLTELRQTTTYPPYVYAATNFSDSLVLTASVTRDTGSNPDVGYHYAPIDYALGGVLVTNAVLTIDPGCVVAAFATNGSQAGLTIGTGAELICLGTPANLNHIVAYNTVQEQSATGWAMPTNGLLRPNPSPNSPGSLINCRFTDFSILAQDASPLYDTNGNSDPVNFQDCQFHGGTLYSTNVTVNLTNCLLDRVSTTLWANDGNAPQIRNNLFRSGSVDLKFTPTNSLVQNNLFDQTSITDHGISNYVGTFNGYLVNSNHLTLTNSHDVFLSSSPIYQTGPLGDYYQPTNDSLFHVGSTNASLLAMYQYTTQTNQTKEGTNRVTIGYHYVATDSSGNPLDSNGNGNPDYLEDPNGDGSITIVLTNPTNNASFDGPLTLSVQASVFDWSAIVTNVQFLRGTTLIGTVTNSPWQCSWSNVAPGLYTLTAVARDTNGLAFTSSPVSISVTGACSLTYSSSNSFGGSNGFLANLNYTNSSGSLQLNSQLAGFPFLNLATGNSNTVLRLNTSNTTFVGEYLTAPVSKPSFPAHTVVDRNGNTWVANWDEAGHLDGTGKGSITEIGIVIGGTRGYKTNDLGGTNYTFVTNSTGQYLQPPFLYYTAVDRDGDGLIKTSIGQGNVLPWPTNASVAGWGSVTNAADECIIKYVRVPAQLVSALALDTNNDLWVGGYCDDSTPDYTTNYVISAKVHVQIVGSNGMVISNSIRTFVTNSHAYGGFEAIVGPNGALWSSGGANTPTNANASLVFFNPNTGVTNITINGDNFFGMAVDPQTGDVWATSYLSNRVYKFSPTNTLLATYTHGDTFAGDLAIDNSGNVWVAHGPWHGSATIGHLRTDGTFVGNVTLINTNSCSGTVYNASAVTIDSQGKVWAICASRSGAPSPNLVRIDPNGGATITNGGSTNQLGAVDFCMPVPNETDRESYGDMTGQRFMTGTIQSGLWEVTDDSGETGKVWGTLSWNASTLDTNQVRVEVLAGDQISALSSNSFQLAQDSVPLTNVMGRYLEVRVTLLLPPGSTNGPTLHDLTVACANTNLPVVTITYPTNLQRFPYSPTNILITATAGETGGTITNVEFFNGATDLGGTNGSPYQLIWSNVPTGTNALLALATDSNGAIASNSISFSVNIAPSVSVTVPTNHQMIVGSTNITLTATATDSDGTISHVYFYVGTNYVGEGTGTIPSYSFTWTSSGSGSNDVTAVAVDNEGLSTVSAAVPIILVAPPTVTLTSPSDGSFYSPDSNILFSASTTVDPSRVISQVEFFDNTTNSIGVVTSSPYQLTQPFLPSGTNRITAVATDSGGMTATSAEANVVVYARPVITMLFPVNNSTFTEITNITNTAHVASSAAPITNVEFFYFTNSWGNGTASGTNYVITKTLSAGVYPIMAVATDSNGVSGRSQTVMVRVNSTNPVPSVEITYPTNTQVFRADADITITATATNTPAPVTNVEFFVNGQSIGSDPYAPYSIKQCCWKPGTYVLIAQATDTLGMTTNSAPVTIIISNNPPVERGFWDAGLTNISGQIAISENDDHLWPMISAMTSDGTNLYVATDNENMEGSDQLSLWDGTNWSSVGTLPPLSHFVDDFYYNVIRSVIPNRGKIYLSGKFGTSSVTTTPRPKVMAWDGSAWGDVDDTLTYPIGWSSRGSYGSNIFYRTGIQYSEMSASMPVLGTVGSDLYVGGNFASSSDANIHHIARLNPVTSTWEPVGETLNGPVYAICEFNGKLIIGGGFTNAGGNPNANHIAMLDGTHWTNLGSGVSGQNYIDCGGTICPVDVAVWSLAGCGSNLFAGGDFNSAGGNSDARGIAVWNGKEWKGVGKGLVSWQPDVVPTPGVTTSSPYLIPATYAIVPHGNSVYVGGSFGGVQNTDGSKITALNIAGATWNESLQTWSWADLDLGVYDGTYDPADSFDDLVVGGITSLTLINGATDNRFDLYAGGYFHYAGTSEVYRGTYYYGDDAIRGDFARWRVGLPGPTNAPAVSITAPTSYTVFTNNSDPVNDPIAIALTAAATSSYTDIDPDSVRFQVDNKTISATFTTGHFYTNWFQPTNAGIFTLTASAKDTDGLLGQSKPCVIVVKAFGTNVVASNDVYSIVEGSPSLNLNVLTNDTSGSPLHISQVGQTRGNNMGTVTISHDRTYLIYTPLAHYFGTDVFYYSVTNATGDTDSAAVTINVIAPPAVSISDEPATIPTSGLPLPITVQATVYGSTNSIANLALSVTSTSGTQITNHVPDGVSYTFSWSNTPGWYVITGQATDQNGLTSISDPVTFAVVDTNATSSTVTAVIGNFAGLQTTDPRLGTIRIPVITNGLFDLQGTAGDSVPTNPVSYRVLIYEPDAYADSQDDPASAYAANTPLIDVTPGTRNAFGFHEGGVTNGALGQLNFSTLANGVYQMVLQVRGGTDVTNAIQKFSLDSQLKIGQFSFSEQDMVIPANGIPITVIRTYNSLNNYSGDFGYDWSFSINSMDISLDEERTDVVAGGPNDPFSDSISGPDKIVSVRTGGGRDVTLTLPDGRRTTFVFTPSVGELQAYAQWTPAPGVHATLTIPSDQQLINLIVNPIGWQSEADSTFDTHDVPGWQLTTQDGTQYNITRGRPKSAYYDAFGDGNWRLVHAYGPPQLTSIVQRSGDVLNISSNGITHTNIYGGAARSTFFQRDGAGRITAIFDPLGGTNGFPLAQYVYDQDNGNLLQVLKLQDRVAGTYTTNKYHYDNPNFPHYLTSMENPLGVPVARNEYDDQGRLTAVTDALDNRTVFTHNTSNNVEVVTDALRNTNSFVYDLNGNVTAKTNALQQVTLMTYDSQNNKLTDVNVALNATNFYGYDTNNYLTATTNALGYTNLSVYDANGLVWTNIDARGAVTTNNYDGAGNLLMTANAYSTNTFTYDVNNRLLLSVDALSNTTSNSYDGIGNLTNVTVYDATGTVMSSVGYAYDDDGNRTNQTVKRTALGIGVVHDTTTYLFDAQDRLVETIDALGNSNSVIYDPTGKQQTTIDQLGRTTRYFYDDKGNLTNTTYADGSIEVSVYNALNYRIISYNRLGYTNQYFYDALGRITNSVAPDNSSNLTIYDAGGRVQYTVDACGTTNAFGYDLLGQQTSVTNGWLSSASNVMTYMYDGNGNQLTTTDALSHSSTNVYDLLGRVTTNWFADGTKQVMVYDSLGRKVEALDQTNNPTWLGYDGLGRLTSVTNALNKVTSYAYDEAGNQTNQVDALLRTNTYFYDALGRRTKHALPDSHSETFGYDSAGNQILFTNFNGVIITNKYDLMNRLTNRASVGGALAFFTYTTDGQRATMIDLSGTYAYIYDVMDRVCTNITPQGTLSYEYGTNGNLTNISSSTSGGTSVGYQYDPLNRLTNVVDFRLNSTQNTALGYDAVGNLQKMLYPNSVTNSYQYDTLNRLTGLTWKTNGVTIASFTYQLGTTGNRTGVSETIGSTTSRIYGWRYDNAYRLTNETVTGSAPTGALGYAYDDVGNRLSRTNIVSGLGLGDQDLTYGTNDWLTTDIYDNDGNTTISGTTNYLYDAENRLTNVNWTGHSITIGYNGDGLRVSKAVTVGVLTTTTLYLVDTHNLTGYAQVLEEFADDTNHLARAYTYGLSLICQRLPGLGGITNFFGYDGLGHVRFLTSTNGTMTDSYTYDAYGILINSTGTTPNNYLYCGEQWDGDLGLHFLRSRYMNSRTGRFWTVDNSEGEQGNPLSLHKYLYAESDPINRIDPSGQDSYSSFDTFLNLASGVSLFGNYLRSGCFFPNYDLPQTPDVNSPRLTADVNAIEIRHPNRSVDALFGELTALKQTEASVKGAPVLGVGQEIWWTLHPWYVLFGQSGFGVRSTKFVNNQGKDGPLDHYFVVETMQGHPLSGWRFWRVYRKPHENTVEIETGAVEQPAGILNSVKTFAAGDEIALSVWKSQMEDMEIFSLGKRMSSSRLKEGRFDAGLKAQFLKIVQ